MTPLPAGRREPAPPVRQQLTLFVEAPWRSRLNAYRQGLDPVQAALISAHVTLCREDELDVVSLTGWVERATAWRAGPMSLRFGSATRFGGHGVLLPCEDGQASFQALRQWMLDPLDAREHAAHLTLAHPRNPRAIGNTEEAVQALPTGLALRLASVSLIRQHGEGPWRVVQEAPLGGCTWRDSAAGPEGA